MNASARSTDLRPPRSTIQDVARRAEVSIATVSRVINAPDSVRPETRDRVRTAMSALAYGAYGAARPRAASGTGNIGVLLLASPGITQTDSFFLDILSGIESAAEPADFAVVVSVRQSISELEQRGASLMTPGRVDGLIVTGTQLTRDQLDGLRRTGLPVVLLGIEEEVTGSWCISADTQRGAGLATTHLLQLGRRRIVHIGGPLDGTGPLKKHLGYRLAHERQGVALDPRLHDASDEIHSRGRGWRCVERMLGAAIEFDAIFADDDLLAAGALEALIAHGRRVPEDVSVVGFGGLAEARSTRPALTTVDGDFHQQGWLAGTILSRVLQTPDRAPRGANILVETRLVMGESSVPPGTPRPDGGTP